MADEKAKFRVKLSEDYKRLHKIGDPLADDILAVRDLLPEFSVMAVLEAEERGMEPAFIEDLRRIYGVREFRDVKYLDSE